MPQDAAPRRSLRTIVAIAFFGVSTGHADVVRVYHPNGALRYEGTTSAGERDGLFRYFATDGTFLHQAYFYRGIEIWRSSDAGDTVPADVIESFAATYRWESRQTAPARNGLGTAPFATLDRSPAGRRVGAAFGVGSGGDLGVASIFRLDVFANYDLSFAGVYGQISQGALTGNGSSFLVGKSTIDLGGTTHQDLGVPTTFRMGLVFPIFNDDDPGFLGSAAGTVMRPADAVASFASTFALRSSASVSIVRARYRIQADAGFDVAIGGAEKLNFQPLARANLGVGWGNEERLLAVELSNTLDIAEPTHRLHSVALSGTVDVALWSLTGALVVTTAGHLSAITSVTHDL